MGGGRQGIYAVPTAIDRDRSGLDARIHTTQKPVALMEALLRDFTDVGETVLDSFAGTGTTGVAAIRLGRGFIGWERDAEYHRAAVERLGRTRALPVAYQAGGAQGELFAAPQLAEAERGGDGGASDVADEPREASAPATGGAEGRDTTIGPVAVLDAVGAQPGETPKAETPAGSSASPAKLAPRRRRLTIIGPDGQTIETS
jgi:hypothetical protein